MAEAVQKFEEAPFKVRDSQNMFALNGVSSYARASVTLPAGVPFEVLLLPETWAQVAERFARDQQSGRADLAGALIDVRTQDHAFFGTLYVRAVRDRALIVQAVEGPIYLGLKEVKAAGYEVRWNVGKRKFDIIRQADREVVAAVDTREAAADWIGRTTKAA